MHIQITLCGDKFQVKLIILNVSAKFSKNSISSVVVITAAQLHSTKPQLRFCAGSNPARGVSEICDVEDL